MTEFIFIRHGETEMNLQPHLVGGQSNHTPLSQRGLTQAQRIGDYLHQQQLAPDAIFSSGALRADTTARIALQQTNITQPIAPDERLLEMSQGRFEGLPRTEVYTEDNLHLYNLERIDGKLPTGESVLDVQLRKESFLDDRHAQYPDGLVIVFGHGLAIRSLAGKILGHTKQQILSQQTGNVSITIIDVVDHTPSVRCIGKDVI